MGLMEGPGTSEYEVISRLSVGIKSVAKLLNIPVIVLSQVNRKGGGGTNEISLDMGRGSGAIEEGADFVLGLWQVEKAGDVVGTDESHIDYDLVCRILKNRKGFCIIDISCQIVAYNVDCVPSFSQFQPGNTPICIERGRVNGEYRGG